MPKLQVVADFLSQEPAPHADAHPVAKPVKCAEGSSGRPRDRP